MSSAEAEYAAASQTCREMTYIRNVCGDLGLVLRGRLCLAVDNTAAIDICENPGVTARNKHFSDAVHYVPRDRRSHPEGGCAYVSTSTSRAQTFALVRKTTKSLLHGTDPGSATSITLENRAGSLP